MVSRRQIFFTLDKQVVCEDLLPFLSTDECKLYAKTEREAVHGSLTTWENRIMIELYLSPEDTNAVHKFNALLAAPTKSLDNKDIEVNYKELLEKNGFKVLTWSQKTIVGD